MSQSDHGRESLVFGMHAVRTLLQRRPERALTLILQKGREDARVSELVQRAQACGVRIEWREARELDRLAGGERSQGACLQVRPATTLGEGALDDLLERAGPQPLLLVLDGVQDPHNLGACLRTADAAGACAVIAPRDRAAGLSATVRKVASGAAETLPLIQVVNLARTLRWLKEREIWIVGTDDEASASLYGAKLTGPLAVVLGGEGSGLRRLTREGCDLLVRIPMKGVVESLNVSVAAGVVLYEAVRQREAAQ
ncbi:MAG: 23S rRNA (guanosine(2251)-2'-O)-methyltransferase RlmB [Steroidobacteraceae bacterium]|jgi:23S rRNA (guanosine2251-2'-O)-methyltransferase|nr:23S rRNA (guanosine(2251)-2'-O)-methyltransferase RlmB [Steroidobacteraceae bacterium]